MMLVRLKNWCFASQVCAHKWKGYQMARHRCETVKLLDWTAAGMAKTLAMQPQRSEAVASATVSESDIQYMTLLCFQIGPE